MSNKRVVAREWKRKRQQKKRAAQLTTVAIVAVIALGIGLFFMHQHSLSYVMVFEGQRVPAAELEFMGSMDNLIDFWLIEQAAENQGLALGAEELESMEAFAAELRQMYVSWGMPDPAISDRRMAVMLGMETLRSQLIDVYTADFAVDEAEFATALEAHMAPGRAFFAEMSFKYVFANSYEESQEAWVRLQDGEDVDAIIIDFLERDFVDTTDPDFEITTISLEDLRTGELLAPDVLESLLGMEVGTFTEPIPMDMGWDDETYLVLFVETAEIPTEAEIEERFREQFTAEGRSVVFEGILQGWRDAADIQLNQRGIDAVFPA